MPFERIIVVADEFSTSDRPFALARRLSTAGDLTVEVVYGVLPGHQGEGIPGWRLQRRLDAHGLSAAELRVLRADEPELALCEHLAGHDGSLLLDRTAEAIMSHLPHPLLLLGPRQTNPRGDAQLSPITVRDGASEAATLDSATETWISTFTKVQPELLDVFPPDPWPRSGVDPGPKVREARSGTVLTELRAVDLGDAVLSHLNGRRDAVVVVSSPRWSSAASHWWSTARRLVRHLSCPVLVVPMVGRQ
jgi:nucleotide-binding universal stress UspA family protein